MIPLAEQRQDDSQEKAAMSDRYKDSYRGYLIDHHSPNRPTQRLDKLDLSMTGRGSRQVVELPPVDMHAIVSVEA